MRNFFMYLFMGITVLLGIGGVNSIIFDLESGSGSGFGMLCIAGVTYMIANGLEKKKEDDYY